MGIHQREFILATVALLLNPTLGDVLVQPGYSKQGKSKDPVVQSQSSNNQAISNPQQNFYPQQDPTLQLLQQQHALENQYLQHQHQQEHNQLLQLQQQELHSVGMSQNPHGGQDVVGSIYGFPNLIAPPPFGAGLTGGRVFSLGPLGLHTLRLGGGLGGMGFPLLLSPHQPGVMPGGTQFQKSMDLPTQSRARREVRDPGESSGRKYRQKNIRTQQDGLATNTPLKSNQDSISQNSQTSKANDQIVGDEHNEENVGSSVLDPLGLMDKTEDLIDGLKSGHIPNPLDALTHGGLNLPGLPGWLNKASSSTPQFEEHVVGQSQQQYPMQGKYNGYNMINQQQSPIVGDPKQHGGPNLHGYSTPQGLYGSPGVLGSPYPYGMSQSPQYRSWMSANTMNMQGNGMGYGKIPNWAGPMTGSVNPGLPKSSGSNFAGNQMMTGMENPTTLKTEKPILPGQLSGMNSMGKSQMLGAPNPQLASGTAQGYNQILGSSNPAENLYELAKVVQPMVGELMNPSTAGWGRGATPYGHASGAQNPMIGNPMMNNLYDSARRMNNYGYNGGYNPFDMDNIYDMYDDRYHHMHRGGFDRIYETFTNNPYGFGNGRPHYVQSYDGYTF